MMNNSRQNALEHAVKSKSYWYQSWRQLKQNRLAMSSFVFLCLLILSALLLPLIASYSYHDQNIEKAFLPPLSGNHWFGTDDLGRDVFARLWVGARISLFIGFLAAFIDLVIGVVVGSISGYFGGKVDHILMRLVDILYGIPALLLVILLISVMEAGIFTIAVALAVTNWTNMARLVRGQILQLKSQEYILAAQAMGTPYHRIFTRHLLPNTLGVIIIRVTFNIPVAIFVEAFLSYLGLGVRLPMASWGVLAADGTNFFRTSPYLLLIPAFFISITMLAFNLLGDGLRDALDPQVRGKNVS